MPFYDKKIEKYRDKHENLKIARKMRLNLSPKASLIIASDMSFFGETAKTTFINHVFYNYKNQAKASVHQYLYEKEKELKKIIPSDSIDSNTYKNIIDSLISAEKKGIIKEIAGYAKGESKVYYISRQNVDYLLYESQEQSFYGGSHPSKYFKAVLEEYCTLPISKREEIYKSNEFKTVRDAIRKRCCLKIKTIIHGKTVYFFTNPYKILTDPMETQAYFVCKTCRYDNLNAPMKIASFSMCRMLEPELLESEKSIFSENEIKEIEEKIEHLTPAYLTYDEETIRIKLTDTGKRMYQNKLYSRPIKEEGSNENEYVFNCSINQAYNYFISFGKEAEVISPKRLRQWFIRSYDEAKNKYTSAEK